tara:strand:- start:201813 stop:202313 length:501 start_codon:yes stop_codon:yes gene_type:complete
MLDFKLAKVFPKPTIYAGYVLIAIGLFSALFQIFALAFSLIGVFVSLSYNGIQLDPSQRLYRSYSHIFGFKFGSWKSLEKFCDLSILRREDAYKAYSYAMSSFENSAVYFGVFLLNKNHRQKLEIQRHGDKDAAIASAKKLAEELQLEFVAYQPQISQKSQHKRRR